MPAPQRQKQASRSSTDCQRWWLQYFPGLKSQTHATVSAVKIKQPKTSAEIVRDYYSNRKKTSSQLPHEDNYRPNVYDISTTSSANTSTETQQFLPTLNATATEPQSQSLATVSAVKIIKTKTSAEKVHDIRAPQSTRSQLDDNEHDNSTASSANICTETQQDIPTPNATATDASSTTPNQQTRKVAPLVYTSKNYPWLSFKIMKRKTSSERVREFRARQRARRQLNVDDSRINVHDTTTASATNSYSETNPDYFTLNSTDIDASSTKQNQLACPDFPVVSTSTNELSVKIIKRKTSTERCRKFRARQKDRSQLDADINQTNVHDISTASSSDLNKSSETEQDFDTLNDTATDSNMPKTNSEYCLEYRLQKMAANEAKNRGLPVKKALTSAERVRQFRAKKEMLSLVEDVTLAKCFEVTSLADKLDIEAIAFETNLDASKVKKILKHKEHLQGICKYVPNAIKFIAPNELNNIIAMTEILKEFTQQNAKLTDEDLMLNAKILTKVFHISNMEIDEKWIQFFRNNFQQSSSIENQIEKQNILKTYSKHARFCVKRNTDDLILICKKMSKKTDLARKQTHLELSENDERTLHKKILSMTTDMVNNFEENQDTMTDIIEEEPQELTIKEEIEVGEYMMNINANEMLNETQEFWIHEGNVSEKYMNNDDSKEMIEVYAVIDEDEDIDDNNENLIDVDKQTQNCKKQENSNLKLTFNQIKKELIEMNSNEDIKEAEREFEKPVEPKIKQEPDEINAAAYNNETYRDREQLKEPQTMQSHRRNSYEEPMELEIKQESTETIAGSDNNDNYIDQEVFQEPQAMQPLLQQKYIVSMEHGIKQEPMEIILSPNQPFTSNEHEHLKTATFESLNTGIDDSVQNKEHQIDEEPNALVNSDQIKHNDVATILKYSEHLTEQRALEIGKIFNITPYGKLYCEILSLDPIICTYMHMLSNEPLVFSEKALCMSFIVVLGEELYNCPCRYSIQPEDLKLYQQFLLLVYSLKYKLKQLKGIMKGIFYESQIKTILHNSFHILEKWRTFFKKHFISMLYRKAVYEMLFEYVTRYSLISGALIKNDFITFPQTTVKDIKQFLRSDFELGQHWQSDCNVFIRKKVNEMPKDVCRVYTANDLNLNRIYEDIKELLPQLVVENLRNARKVDNRLNVNCDNAESSTAIDCLNVNISMDSNDGKAAMEIMNKTCSRKIK